MNRLKMIQKIAIFILVILIIVTSFVCDEEKAAIANYIVINEVELNPEGEDSGNEWVELFNPTKSNTDISGWSLHTISSLNNESYVFPKGTLISASGFRIFTYPKRSLDNDEEMVVLKDAESVELDKTINMYDHFDDNRTWSRVPNGQDSDDKNDWKFQTSTRGY
jgi:hypothetical protein